MLIQANVSDAMRMSSLVSKTNLITGIKCHKSALSALYTLIKPSNRDSCPVYPWRNGVIPFATALCARE